MSADEALNHFKENVAMRNEGLISPATTAPKSSSNANVHARRTAFAEAMSEALRGLLECPHEHSPDCPSRAKE